MKQISILIIFLFLTGISVHCQCDCAENKSLSKVIKCDTIILKNKSLLYRQFNCDSSWLVFEYKKGLKKELCSLSKDLIDITDRLGYHYVTEYNNAILFENRQASGGGFPINYVLIDKKNGLLYKDIGPILYFINDSDLGFVLFLSDSSSVILYNVDLNKNYRFSIPDNRIDITMKQTGGMFPEFLFEEPIVLNNKIEINYKFQKQNDSVTWYKDKIIIDLKNYAR